MGVGKKLWFFFFTANIIMLRGGSQERDTVAGDYGGWRKFKREDLMGVYISRTKKKELLVNTP